MITKLNKSSLILLAIALTFFNPATIPAPTVNFPTVAPAGATEAHEQPNAQSAPTNLTIDGAITYQTMNGIGSNVNSWSWKNGEIIPALDMLVDILGHNIFRVVHDRMEWAGTGNIRPAATLANLQSLDPATLISVYEVPDMQDMWDTIAYLNSKGVPGDQIIINFQGWTAQWMGGSGGDGTASFITNDAQTNQDVATMIASLVYYGHHRRDVSGNHQNLAFTYIAPFNEPDYDGIEGPEIGEYQLNTIYENIVTDLNAMGDTTTMLVAPETAGNPDRYTNVFSAAVLARLRHFSWHWYSVNPASLPASRSGINADWLTETSVWCEGCDHNQPPTQGEWAFGSGIGEMILGDLANGFSAVLTWEAFDTYYYNHDSYHLWGHIGCIQNGSGCTTSDVYRRVYYFRDRAWPEATIAKAVRPGMVRRGLTTTLPNLTASSFYDATTGRFSIVGHNTGVFEMTINGELHNLPTISSLALYETNALQNLDRKGDVVVAGGLFTATIPADTFFYLSSPVTPMDMNRVWLPIVIN